MKKEALYDGITEIREDIIKRAAGYQFEKEQKPKNRAWTKWVTMAACLCLMVGIGVLVLSPKGNNSGSYGNNGGNDVNGGGGTGKQSGTVFSSYAGPVFPLNALTDASGIVAERNIDFDFLPYKTELVQDEPDAGNSPYRHYSTESIVTDGYTLNNSTKEDLTVTLSYPFVSSFYDAHNYVPTIRVNGKIVETELAAGSLADAKHWEDFQVLLQGSSYLESAYAEAPVLDEKVIVYRVSNMAYRGSDKKAVNPTLSLEFYADYQKTSLFTSGFNGFHRNMETGRHKQNASIPREQAWDYGMDRYLVVLGEDIADLKLQGYPDGGCDDGEEIDGVTADVVRYEAPLSELLWEFYRNNRKAYFYLEEAQSDLASDELMYGTVAKFMQEEGILSDSVIKEAWERYEEVWSANYTRDRVLYVTFDVVIPAGSSVQVEAVMKKDASFDYAGEGTDRNGYDMVTSLGSTLEFSGQWASISNSEHIEILAQNFGFDVENGITQVQLDMEEPHYYLEIRKKSTE